MAENTANVGNGATLGTLLMKTGPLPDLISGGGGWPGIAQELSNVFLTYIKTKLTLEDQAEYAALLCTTYYAYGKNPTVHNLGDAKYALQQVPAVVNFLHNLMVANGQWGYIQQQGWYTSGDYIIAVDANYYPDRSGYKASPIFHKDTAGNNIFVNLIFDNKNAIEATEWFTDVHRPSDRRLRWQQNLLPEAYLKDLDGTRTVLRDSQSDSGDIHGGVSRGTYTYVSWVDDLVWHATPALNRRAEYTREAALRAHQPLSTSLDLEFEHRDDQLGLNILGLEVVGTMAEAPETELRKWLTKKVLTVQDINFEVAQLAWRELYQGNLNQYTADVTKRLTLPWRITGEYSVVLEEDSRLQGSTKMNETPVGLSTRRRADSLDENQAVLREVRDANKGVARSFLRSWVRILPKDSSELTKAGIVLQ